MNLSARAFAAASLRRTNDARRLALTRIPQELGPEPVLDPVLPVVLIHLGSRYPPHLRACAAQVRAASGYDPLVVGHRMAERYDGESLRRFRAVEGLSGLGDRFWRYACERFFVLEEVMARRGIDRCIHIESDVLMYQGPAQLAGWLMATYGDALAACPLTDTEDTAAIMYVGSLASLRDFNVELLRLVTLGPAALLERHGGTMGNEMRMLHVLRTELSACRPLPTTIEEALAEGAPCLFDPASYGQWVDGIPGRPGVPYAGEHHAIGREFLAGRYELRWDAQVRMPTVRRIDDPLTEWPLANLHLHSKRLPLFTAHRAEVTGGRRVGRTPSEAI